MKADLIAHSNKIGSNVVYTDFFTGQDFNIILLTYNEDNSKLISDINTLIINYILELTIDNIDSERIIYELSEHLNSLNLLIFSRFKKEKAAYSNISLSCFISHHDKNYIIKFGDFQCFQAEKNQTKRIGQKKSNYIGKTSETIKISIERVYLPLNSYFICGVFSPETEKIIEKELPINDKINLIKSEQKKNDKPFFIIKEKVFKKVPKAIVLRIRKRVVSRSTKRTQNKKQ